MGAHKKIEVLSSVNTLKGARNHPGGLGSAIRTELVQAKAQMVMVNVSMNKLNC